MTQSILIFCIIILTFFSFPAKADIIELEKKESKVIYTLTSYGIPFKIKALPTTGELNIEDENNLIKLKEINMKAHFTSKLALFRKLVEFDKYPYFSFSSEFDYPVDLNSLQCIEIEGTLTFHGVSKKIKVTLSPALKDKLLILKSSFNIKMSEFGLKPPRILFLKVDDLIKTKIELAVKHSQT